MGPDDYILAIYAVSGTLAFGCAFLPGAGPVGRLLNIFLGAALLSWTANVYLRGGWFSTSPAILLIPLLLLAYALMTVRRLRRLHETEWFSPAYREEAARFVPASAPDRRGPGRRLLPGEYSSTPINHLPPPHDPWAALYASVEREILRGDVGRHRPTTQLAATARSALAGHSEFSGRTAATDLTTTREHNALTTTLEHDALTDTMADGVVSFLPRPAPVYPPTPAVYSAAQAGYPNDPTKRAADQATQAANSARRAEFTAWQTACAATEVAYDLWQNDGPGSMP